MLLSVFLSTKPVHIELTNEAVDFIVSEILRQHHLLELIDVLDDELGPCSRPKYYSTILFVLNSEFIYIEDLKSFSDEACYLVDFVWLLKMTVHAF